MDHSFDFVVRVRGFIIKVCWTSFAPGIKSNRRERLTMVRLLSACVKLGLYGPTMVRLYGVWPVWAYNGAPVWGWAGGSGRGVAEAGPGFPVPCLHRPEHPAWARERVVRGFTGLMRANPTPPHTAWYSHIATTLPISSAGGRWFSLYVKAAGKYTANDKWYIWYTQCNTYFQPGCCLPELANVIFRSGRLLQLIKPQITKCWPRNLMRWPGGWNQWSNSMCRRTMWHRPHLSLDCPLMWQEGRQAAGWFEDEAVHCSGAKRNIDIWGQEKHGAHHERPIDMYASDSQYFVW